MNRRNFMRLSALGMAWGLWGTADGKEPGADSKEPREGGLKPAFGKRTSQKEYSVLVLGDTHFDRWPDGTYHDGYTHKNAAKEAHVREVFVRNYEMWNDRMRRLLRRASALIGPDTRMAIQLGDLIQGDTKDAATHKRYLDDAYCHIRGALGSIPLVTVAGNHDVRGVDSKVAAQAYADYMTQRMSAELGKDIGKTCFSFWIGRDAYIAVDFVHPDDEEIDRLFSETEGARYTFVLIHAPVIPYQNVEKGNWIIHGTDGNDEARRHFRGLLARRNAIVLCGHTHNTEHAIWEGDGGRITQMTVSSVWATEANGVYTERWSSAEDYCHNAIERGPDAVRELAREYKPGIKAFSYAKTCGSYMLRVSGRGVWLELYAGDSQEVTKVFRLR